MKKKRLKYVCKIYEGVWFDLLVEHMTLSNIFVICDRMSLSVSQCISQNLGVYIL